MDNLVALVWVVAIGWAAGCLVVGFLPEIKRAAGPRKDINSMTADELADYRKMRFRQFVGGQMNLAQMRFYGRYDEMLARMMSEKRMLESQSPDHQR